MPAQKKEWKHSILNCCSAGFWPCCLCAVGCECWNYGDAMIIMDPKRDFCDEFVRALICCCWLQRGEMREKYHIEGSCAGDCCATCLCYPCAAIQMVAEAKERSGVQYKPVTAKDDENH